MHRDFGLTHSSHYIMAKSLSRFYVRKQDEKNEIATLFFRVQNKKHKVDMLFSSQIRVNVAEWKEALSCPENWMRHQRANFNLHDALNRIELVVKSEVEGMSFDKSHVESEILAIANPKKAEAIAKAKREEEERLREEERIKEEQARLIKEGIDAERAKIWNFLDRFCEEIKTGARLNGHSRYAPGTVKAWFSFRKLYDQFDKKHRYTWNMVDRAFVTKFLAFMEKNDYMVSAQNKYLVDLRAIVNYAYLDGIHDNDRAMQYFAKKKIEEGDKAIEIYLTEAELQALYEMPLTGKQDEVRDIFLVGCYTCQRVSDYNDIDKDCFTTTAKGTPVIRLVQKKTRNEVKIPIMNPNLRAICEKYAYNLPSVVDVILNRYIKDILKRLSETVPSLGKMVTTKLTMKQKKLEEDGKLVVERNEKGEVIMPRYNCVTTHTARRSGITNMYLTHKYTIVQMMHVSGHKTQKTFMDYIKLSSDEIADEIDAIANGTKSEVF